MEPEKIIDLGQNVALFDTSIVLDEHVKGGLWKYDLEDVELYEGPQDRSFSFSEFVRKAKATGKFIGNIFALDFYRKNPNKFQELLNYFKIADKTERDVVSSRASIYFPNTSFIKSYYNYPRHCYPYLYCGYGENNHVNYSLDTPSESISGTRMYGKRDFIFLINLNK